MTARLPSLIDPKMALLVRNRADITSHVRALAGFQGQPDLRVTFEPGHSYLDLPMGIRGRSFAAANGAVNASEVIDAIHLVGDSWVDNVIVLAAAKAGRWKDVIRVVGLAHERWIEERYAVRASDGSLVSGNSMASARSNLKSYEAAKFGENPWRDFEPRLIGRPDFLIRFWPTDVRATTIPGVARVNGYAVTQRTFQSGGRPQCVYVAPTSNDKLMCEFPSRGDPNPFAASRVRLELLEHEKHLHDFDDEDEIPDEDMDAIGLLAW